MISEYKVQREWSLVTWIVVINIAVAVGSLTSLLLFGFDVLQYYGALRIDTLIRKEWWRFFTYMWLHADPLGWGVLHIMFNMATLWMFGKPVERILGKRGFLGLYFLGAFAAAGAFFLEFWIRCDFHTWVMALLPHTVIGASGAVVAIIAFFSCEHPDVRVYIMFIPFAIKIKYAVIGFVVVSAAMLFYPPLAFIGHSAHIGGIVLGYLWWVGWNLLRRRARSL
ncbi:MAG: rhomboid family intramembrane serine protease [Verrucomicrobiota bacterium]